MSWKKANRRKPHSRQKKYADRRITSVTIHSFQRQDESTGFYVDPRHEKNGIKTTFEESPVGTTVRFHYQTTGGDYSQVGQGFIMSVEQRRHVEYLREQKHLQTVASLRVAGRGKAKLGLVDTLSVQRGVPWSITIKEVAGHCVRHYEPDTNWHYYYTRGAWSWTHTDDPLFGKIYPECLPFIDLSFDEVYHGNTRDFFLEWVRFAQGVLPVPTFEKIRDTPTKFPPISTLIVGNGDGLKELIFPKKE